jgi:hypothetical protein
MALGDFLGGAKGIGDPLTRLLHVLNAFVHVPGNISYIIK